MGLTTGNAGPKGIVGRLSYEVVLLTSWICNQSHQYENCGLHRIQKNLIDERFLHYGGIAYINRRYVYMYQLAMKDELPSVNMVNWPDEVIQDVFGRCGHMVTDDMCRQLYVLLQDTNFVFIKHPQCNLLLTNEQNQRRRA